MSANSQVAFTQLDEEVSTFYHRYSRGKENQALYLTAFGCLENSVPKAVCSLYFSLIRNFLNLLRYATAIILERHVG